MKYNLLKDSLYKEASLLIFYSENSFKLAPRALRLANFLNKDIKRRDKRQEKVHYIGVSFILKEFDITDDVTHAAAILHDCKEHGLISIGRIRKMFGTEVANIVMKLTKFDREGDRQKWTRCSTDYRAMLVALADRAHTTKDLHKRNVFTLEGALKNIRQTREVLFLVNVVCAQIASSNEIVLIMQKLKERIENQITSGEMLAKTEKREKKLEKKVRRLQYQLKKEGEKK